MGLTFWNQKYIMVPESEVSNISPRTGRPKAENPKTASHHVRLDAETNKRLIEYCNAHGISQVEAIRQGIHLLLAKEK